MDHSPANFESPSAGWPPDPSAGAPADRAAPPNRRDADDGTAAVTVASAVPNGVPLTLAGHPTVDRVTVERRTAGKRLVALLRRWGAWLVRWFRDYFSAERMMTFVKSLLWVAPLTVLIWVYAERQQQYTATGQVLPIEVVSGDPNRFALLQRPNDGNVIVALKGPKANVDRLVEQLRAPGAAPIQIQADRTGRDGEQNLTIPSARIGQDKRFIDAGITVENAQPESLVVRVEPIVEMDVPIQPLPEQRDQYPNVEFTPPKLRVRGPASIVGDKNDARNPDPKVIVYADLGKRPEAQGEPDQERVVSNVKVALSVVSKSVSMAIPAPGSVSARIRPSGTEEFTIESLPAKIVPGAAARDFEWPEVVFVPNITVTGPKAKIEALASQRPPAFAELPAGVQIPAGAQSVDVDAVVKYQFAEAGVTLKSGPATVKVNLKPRQ